MCDIWKTTENKSFQLSDLEPHLDSIRHLGIRWIVFSGGEPLLNPHLPALCAILRKQSIQLTLLTTGLLLSKLADQVADSFDDIIVSLDGPEEIHDEIRRVPRGFSLLQTGIAAVRQRRPQMRITARTTIQKANHSHIRDTVQAAKQLQLDGISFLAADLTSSAFNRPLPWSIDRQQGIGLFMQELMALEREIESLIDEHAMDIKSGFIAESPEKLRKISRHFRAYLGLAENESPLCNAPWVSAVVETNGAVRPCFFHRPIGNLKEGTLLQILNGADARRFRAGLDIANNPICNHCVCSLNYGE